MRNRQILNENIASRNGIRVIRTSHLFFIRKVRIKDVKFENRSIIRQRNVATCRNMSRYTDIISQHKILRVLLIAAELK